MHELSIIASLFDILVEKAKEQNAKKVVRVVLQVGKLSGVVPDFLESSFEIYRKGTLAEEAVLEIASVPLKLRCQSCSTEFVKDDYIFSCPACDSTDLKILEGTELILEKIELEL